MRQDYIKYGIFVFLIVIVAIGNYMQVKEPFAYAQNPCGSHNDCVTCSAAAGCGWCSDVKECHPMYKDGFPERLPEDDNEYPQRPICNAFTFRIRPEQC